MSHAPTLGLVAYDGVQMSAVLGLQDLFQVASTISQRMDGSNLNAVVLTPDDLDVDIAMDVIILPPNLSGARGASDVAQHNWIKTQHARGALVCSVCAGAFWLGHSGLLDGRPVTTHWALEQEFQTAFPKADLLPEHILIDDNDIVTAGGLMAWLDLGLFLVNRFLGSDILSQTARHLLIDPQGRDQRNYRSFTPTLTHGDPDVLRVQHWMEGNVGADASGRRLASICGTSERSFLRKFGDATGHSPNTYLRLLRIEKARGMLERTRMNVSQISWAVGYGDVSAFCRVFKTVTGLTPREYRTRFSVLQRPDDGGGL